MQRLFKFHYKTFHSRMILDNKNRAVYNEKQTHVRIFPREQNIYVQEKKKTHTDCRQTFCTGIFDKWFLSVNHKTLSKQ